MREPPPPPPSPAEPIPRQQVTGLLLAGGRGSRMGGADKGLLPLHGRPLAQHVLDRLRPQVAEVLLSANRHVEDYAALGATVLRDADPQAFAGPLAGIAAGLRACGTPWLLCVPCDAPGLPPDLAHRLGAAALAAGSPAAIAEAGGRSQPVFALLRRELLDSLLDYLAGGGRKVETWLHSVGCVRARFDDPRGFDNVNLPQQLQALQSRPEHPA